MDEPKKGEWGLWYVDGFPYGFASQEEARNAAQERNMPKVNGVKHEKRLTYALFVMALMIIVAIFYGREKPHSPTFEKGNYEGRIDDWVLADYTDESLIHGSETSPNRGVFSSMVGLINKQKIDASKHVLDYGGCDYVESSVFNLNESTPDNLIYWIHCSNGKVFNVSSRDIGKEEIIKSDFEKAISQTDAISQCKKLIAGKVTEIIPNGAKIEYHELLGMSYYKAPNGNVALRLDFDVVIGLAGKAEFKSICYFEPNGRSEIGIEKI